MRIKGVNLGNWLVLEKWMDVSLFDGVDSEDEYYFAQDVEPNEYQKRIQKHRDTYITEEDFKKIAGWGLNSVRIPVPYFLFGDRPPFIGCTAEIDKAFQWAEKYGLTVLLDLHTAPYSQNGFDNGGISGVCKWAQIKNEVDFVISVLERLAVRYGKHPALFGIQAINEPITNPIWKIINVQKRYPPRDKKLAAGTKPIPIKFIENFYKRVYAAIRKHLSADKFIVFHDAFRFTSWKNFFTKNKFENVILDTHMYLMGMNDKECKTIEDFTNHIEKNFKKKIENMQTFVPAICGEWCLSNFLGARENTNEKKMNIYTAIAEAQLDSWRNTFGYYFWSYRVFVREKNSEKQISQNGWSMEGCVKNGWITAEMIKNF